MVFRKYHIPYRVWRVPHFLSCLESSTLLVVFGECHTHYLWRIPHSWSCLESATHTPCVWRASHSLPLESSTLLVVFEDCRTHYVWRDPHSLWCLDSATLITFGEFHTPCGVWRVPHSLSCLKSATFITFGEFHTPCGVLRLSLSCLECATHLVMFGKSNTPYRV